MTSCTNRYGECVCKEYPLYSWILISLQHLFHAGNSCGSEFLGYYFFYHVYTVSSVELNVVSCLWRCVIACFVWHNTGSSETNLYV